MNELLRRVAEHLYWMHFSSDECMCRLCLSRRVLPQSSEEGCEVRLLFDEIYALLPDEPCRFCGKVGRPILGPTMDCDCVDS